MTELEVVTDAGFEIGPLLHQSRKADAGVTMRGRPQALICPVNG